MACMNRRMRRCATFFVLIASLLFQQLAVAAYVCPFEVEGLVPGAGEECAEMGMTSNPDRLDPDFPSLCAQHCEPDRAIVLDLVVAGVPRLPFAELFEFPAEIRPGTSSRHVASASLHDPPCRLRYCTLLI